MVSAAGVVVSMLVVFGLAGCAGGSPVRPLSEFRVLDDEKVAVVRPGLTRDEVLRELGPPIDTMHYPRLGHTSWDYRYVDTWGYQSIFSVTFDAGGIVVSRITLRIDRDRPSPLR
jgi:outer membrane protein assembly factor BamE (lipoprotein component of BamABCDE complex)